MISFILPIYNQEHVLEKSVLWLVEFMKGHENEEYEILICNDGSPDNCLEIAERLSKSSANVKSISYEKNRGRGYAIKYAGMRAKGMYLIYLDCDLLEDKNQSYLEQMISDVKENDIVIASRFLNDSDSQRKWHRMIVSKCYRLLVNIMFKRFPVTDPDVGFKGFNKNVFDHINLVSNLNGFCWDLQFLVNAVSEGYKVHEYPFDYKEDYERTTVNIITCSLIEFMSLVYIKITRSVSDRIVF